MSKLPACNFHISLKFFQKIIAKKTSNVDGFFSNNIANVVLFIESTAAAAELPSPAISYLCLTTV